MNADDEFASVILVKHNIVDVLRRELDRPAWTRERVAVGTATDPYQPIEGHYKLTRQSIQALTRGRTPISLITKGPMIAHRRPEQPPPATICVSVPIDDDAWRLLEPGTAHPLQRLRAVASSHSGLNAGVDGPHRPRILVVSKEARMDHQGTADHGARFWQNVIPAGRNTYPFHEFIEREFPSMAPRFEKYARKHPLTPREGSAGWSRCCRRATG
jgi:hypothetical protein